MCIFGRVNIVCGACACALHLALITMIWVGYMRKYFVRMWRYTLCERRITFHLSSVWVGMRLSMVVPSTSATTNECIWEISSWHQRIQCIRFIFATFIMFASKLGWVKNRCCCRCRWHYQPSPSPPPPTTINNDPFVNHLRCSGWMSQVSRMDFHKHKNERVCGEVVCFELLKAPPPNQHWTLGIRTAPKLLYAI